MKQLTLAYSPFGDRGNSTYPFNQIYPECFNPLVTGSLEGADALLLWGGEDINPAFYKQDYHLRTERTGHTGTPSLRDMVEWQLMHEAKAKEIPIIGVCRGAQFLCVFAGGSLIQDCKGHFSGHVVVTPDGLSMHAAANHHQVMNPEPGTYNVLAWAEKFGTDHQIEYGKKPTGVLFEKQIDPEVLWFPKVRGLAIQPHPEWMPENSQFVKWVLEQVTSYCVEGEQA